MSRFSAVPGTETPASFRPTAVLIIASFDLILSDLRILSALIKG